MSDYIKREDALMAILALEDRDIPEDRYPDTEFAFNEGLVRAADKVNAIPAADVVPVVCGKWEHDGFNWFCNRCNYNALCDKDTGEEVLSPRCPNCGADMREESR